MSVKHSSYITEDAQVAEDKRSPVVGPSISPQEVRLDEIDLTRKLEACLRDNEMYTSAEERAKRSNILDRLKHLYVGWIQEITHDKNLPETTEASDVLHVFGSHSLGLITKSSDIDLLCVAPRHIRRNDFFARFPDVLRSQQEVRDVRAIVEAVVPIIKFNFLGIDIDLLFARLNMEQIPTKLNLKDDRLLETMDRKCISSLNGVKFSDEICSLVPNLETFRIALMAVKLWAKRRNIYSNMVGFLGGVSWTVLVAKTCQTYPNACASVVVRNFFSDFSRWAWPQPVLMKELSNFKSNFRFFSWDPRMNPADRFHLMPIITPCSQQNSSYRVTRSTRDIMQRELSRGHKIVTKLFQEGDSWEKLFAPHDFFRSYCHFLSVKASVVSPDDLKTWTGFVESRLRSLIQRLEGNGSVNLVHVNPEAHVEEHLSREWFVGIQFVKFNNAKAVDIDLSEDVQAFVDTLWRDAGEGNTVDVNYYNKKQLLGYIEVIGRASFSGASRGSSASGMADKTSTEISSSNADSSDNEPSTEFFKTYQHYVAFRGHNISRYHVAEWCDQIRTSLNSLVSRLQANPAVKIASLHPITYPISKSNMSRQWFLGFEIDDSQKNTEDLAGYTQRFAEDLVKEVENTHRGNTSLEVKYFNRSRLAKYLDEIRALDPIH